MRDILSFYKKNLEKLKALAGDCPECIKESIPCRHYDYLKQYIAELEDLPPFDHEKFDLFWKEYPSKKAKPVAMKSWDRLKVDDTLFATIMAALAEHKKSPQWVKDGGQYIPMPSTWLNQRRWEDELKVEGQGSSKYKNQ